jgi:transcriptional regulator with XRE-family HTH domain
MRVGLRIKKIRENRSYTQEYMADKLNISQNTYSKIETGGIKLTVDRLKDISGILEIPIEDFLNDDSQTFNFNNNQVAYGYINSLHQDNKELTQKTLKALNDQIIHLQKENERLLKIIEKKLSE